MKNMKGNNDDLTKIIKKDALMPSLISQQDLEKLTMKELNNDLELYSSLLQVK